MPLKVVYIELRREDGSIERASGADASLIWEQIVDALAFCQTHGRPYRGPKFEVVEPDPDVVKSGTSQETD